jgi:8-oxo-dGTP diphosphatase
VSDYRKHLQCTVHPLGELQDYKFVVVCARYNGKWLLSRHKKRDTWETQGGHIEPGENPTETARRELFEESGAAGELYPVCDYNGYDALGHATGVVFLADVTSLSPLPESEMAEVKLFDTLPENLTYPLVSPRLFAEAEKLLEELHIP